MEGKNPSHPIRVLFEDLDENILLHEMVIAIPLCRVVSLPSTIIRCGKKPTHWMGSLLLATIYIFFFSFSCRG